MRKRFILSGLFLLLILGSALYSHPLIDVRAASIAGESTLVLYDASSGAIPSESLLDFTDFPPGAASLTYSEGAAVLDTTLSGSDTFAGWVSGQAITSEFPILDSTASIQVDFSLQVEKEMHAREHRSGFSVIILDHNAKGIELAFWENEIWAQNDDRTGGLFTHGEGVAFATTAGLIHYQVTFAQETYTLTANSQTILTGPVRDYSKFDGFPDPYQTPNFLFLGDDTTSSEARIRLHFVSVTGTQPVLPTSTFTSTGSPPPAVSFTPLPSATPIPSRAPAPSGRIFELCSSGWLFMLVTILGTMLFRGSRR